MEAERQLIASWKFVLIFNSIIFLISKKKERNTKIYMTEV